MQLCLTTMSKKVYYRYNTLTDSYERVYPSRRSRVLASVWHVCLSLMLGAGVFLLLNVIFDTPRERELRMENDALRADLELLRTRMDVAQTVLADIAERDNNFYRVMLQADPITDSRRYSGLEKTQLSSLADNALVRTLNDKMAMLEREIVVQSQSFDELRRLAEKSTDRLAHIPAIQPISEANLKQMASGYGRRTDPIYGTTKFHEGMDFACNVGTPVYATGDGRITAATWHSGYGQHIDISHGYGYTTRYAHLSKLAVKPGQQVKRGDLIGYSGNTGKSTGPHLHYEVRLKDVPQNPVNYYFYDLTPEEYDAMIVAAENAGRVMD